jgi:hypothetical protein
VKIIHFFKGPDDLGEDVEGPDYLLNLAFSEGIQKVKI